MKYIRLNAVDTEADPEVSRRTIVREDQILTIAEHEDGYCVVWLAGTPNNNPQGVKVSDAFEDLAGELQ